MASNRNQRNNNASLDAELILNSGALAKAFQDGDTLRESTLYQCVTALLDKYLPTDRIKAGLDYLKQSRVFSTMGRYARFQPVR